MPWSLTATETTGAPSRGVTSICELSKPAKRLQVRIRGSSSKVGASEEKMP